MPHILFLPVTCMTMIWNKGLRDFPQGVTRNNTIYYIILNVKVKVKLSLCFFSTEHHAMEAY
jgi:hypothetical protein